MGSPREFEVWACTCWTLGRVSGPGDKDYLYLHWEYCLFVFWREHWEYCWCWNTRQNKIINLYLNKLINRPLWAVAFKHSSYLFLINRFEIWTGGVRVHFSFLIAFLCHIPWIIPKIVLLICYFQGIFKKKFKPLGWNLGLNFS